MKIYAVYEVYSKESMDINGFVSDIEYLRTFEKENNMISYIHCELESQCFEDDNWTYQEKVKGQYYIGTIYFCGEEQYKIIGKEISLEKEV